MKPISDDELLALSKWDDSPAWDMMAGAALTDANDLQRLLGMTRLTGRDLARELLALRQAARRVVDLSSVVVNIRDAAQPGAVEVRTLGALLDDEDDGVVDDLRALLPESAGAEGGEGA